MRRSIDLAAGAAIPQGGDRLMASVIGSLYLAGSALVAVSLLLAHPARSDVVALAAIAAGAGLVGAALLAFSGRWRRPELHGALALGSLLVALCIHFSGSLAGVYGSMFVWVVIVAAYFCPGRQAGLHLLWLLALDGVVLAVGGGVAGFSPLTMWLATAITLGMSFAVISWMVLARQRSETERQGTLVRLAQTESLARTDPLTGVPNRRWLAQELPRELARAARRGTTLGVAIVDLDHFKEFNDRHGHAGGDRLLREACGAWRATLRASDFIARFGGDEFVVLLSDCTAEDATTVVERLRAATPGGQACSAGIAVWDGIESGEPLLERADAALYAAKGGGGDRAVAAPAGGLRALAV